MSKKTLNVTDWGFLDDLAEFKVSAEDLKKIFNDEVEEIVEIDPEIPEDELIESAKEALRATLVKNKRGGQIKGKGFNLGISDLNDYTGRWERTQLKAFESLGKKDAKAQKIDDKFYKSQKEMIDAGLISVDKTDPKHPKVVALDKRAKSKSGNENKKFGKAYPAHSFMANFYTIWKPETGGDYKIINIILGGEPSDAGGMLRDQAVSPICPKCGKRGMGMVCTAKDKDKKVCGAKKIYLNKQGEPFAKFLVPDIMKSVGKVTQFPLTIKNNDNGTVKAIYLDSKTAFSNPSDVPLKMDRDANTKLKTLGGELGAILSKFPDRFVTSKEMFDIWSKDKAFLHKPSIEWWKKHHETVYGRDNGKPVFFIAYIVDIGGIRFGRCNILAEDPQIPGVKRDKEDEGTVLNTPEHVYEYNVKGVFGEKSLVLVGATINRIQDSEKDENGKKKGLKTIKVIDSKTKAEFYKPFYSRPQLDVFGMIPIGTPRPPKEEKVLIDLGEDNATPDIPTEEFTEAELAGSNLALKEAMELKKTEEQQMDFEDPAAEESEPEKKAPAEPEEGTVAEASGDLQEPTASEEENFFK